MACGHGGNPGDERLPWVPRFDLEMGLLPDAELDEDKDTASCLAQQRRSGRAQPAAATMALQWSVHGRFATLRSRFRPLCGIFCSRVRAVDAVAREHAARWRQQDRLQRSLKTHLRQQGPYGLIASKEPCTSHD